MSSNVSLQSDIPKPIRTQSNQTKNQPVSLDDVKNIIDSNKNPRDFRPQGTTGKARTDLRKEINAKISLPSQVYIICL